MMTTKIPTLFEYKDEYLAYKRDTLKNRSWTRDRLSLKHLNYSFGNYKLSEIKSGKGWQGRQFAWRYRSDPEL